MFPTTIAATAYSDAASINLPVLEDAVGGPYWDDDLPNVPEAQLGLFVDYDDLDLRSPCLVRVAPAMPIASASGSGFTGRVPGTPTHTPKAEMQDSGEVTLPSSFRGMLSPLSVRGNERPRGPASPLPKSKIKLKPKSKPQGKKVVAPMERAAKEAAKKKKMEDQARKVRERREKKESNDFGKRAKEEGRENGREAMAKGNQENLKALEEKEAKARPFVLRRSSRVAGSVFPIRRL